MCRRPAGKDTHGRRRRVGKDGTRKGDMYPLLLSYSPLLLSSFPLLLLLPFFSLNRPLTTEIDRRWSIFVAPPDSERSAYRSAAGPIRTDRYGVLPLSKANLVIPRSPLSWRLVNNHKSLA
ncbi:hypothetical protein GW17_00057804 [Ensete ventricosum]|nr:hypothetical protein GW17_00057804 [Ensete ventricosum]